MIEYLSGKCIKKLLNGIILSVNGVGYGITLPLNELVEITEQDQIELFIHTHVREDEIRLFGFSSLESKQAFVSLISISGIGPKVAIAILSSLSVGQIVLVAKNGEIERLQSVPGIGKRTAEKILVELKSKVEKWNIPASRTSQTKSTKANSLNFNDGYSDSIYSDFCSALENLGYKEKDFKAIYEDIQKFEKTQDLYAVLKKALSILSESKLANKTSTRISSEKQPITSPIDSLF